MLFWGVLPPNHKKDSKYRNSTFYYIGILDPLGMFESMSELSLLVKYIGVLGGLGVAWVSVPT